MCCASPVAGANAPWKFRPSARSGSTAATPSGNRSGSGCSTIRARSAPAGMKKTDAGLRSIRRSPLRIADPISLRLDVRMAPKYHPTPLSGGDRKALAKGLGKARAMANILLAVRGDAGQGRSQSSRPTSCSAKAGTSGCGATASRSTVSDDRPGRQRRFSLAGDPLRAVQDAERRRSRGDEAPAHDLRARPCQPTAPPQMRQGGTAARGDVASTCSPRELRSAGALDNSPRIDNGPCLLNLRIRKR
jgi:hypothetical protein